MNATKMSKEKGKGEKEISPHTPYIEKGESERETSSPAPSARVRACEVLAIDVHKKPSLDLLIAYAATQQIDDVDWIKAWYKEMTEVYFWCNAKSGEPFKNWPPYFLKCYRNSRKEQRDSAHHIKVRKHADNWRGTRKEDVDDVL